MDITELFEEYRNLSAEDKLRFDTKLYYYQEEEVRRKAEVRLEVYKMLVDKMDENGQLLVSKDWAKKNILGIKDEENEKG